MGVNINQYIVQFLPILFKNVHKLSTFSQKCQLKNSAPFVLKWHIGAYMCRFNIKNEVKVVLQVDI